MIHDKQSGAELVEFVALAMLNSHYRENGVAEQTELGAFDNQYRKDARVAIEAITAWNTRSLPQAGEGVGSSGIENRMRWYSLNADKRPLNLELLKADCAEAADRLAALPPAGRVEEMREALSIFVKAAYPVANEINERGYNWSEAYLDQALVIARTALTGKAHPSEERSLAEQLQYHQAKAHSLMQQIAGDPSKGVIMERGEDGYLRPKLTGRHP